MFDSGSAKPVMIVGMPGVDERGDDRQRAARAEQQRPRAERPLERVEAELDRARVGRNEPGRRRRPALDLELRSLRRGLPQQPLDLGRHGVRRSWPGASRIDRFASATTGQHRLLQLRRPALDAVDVDGRLGERAQVELLARFGSAGRAALERRAPRPRRQRAPVGELLLGRGRERRRGAAPGGARLAAAPPGGSASARAWRSAPRRRRARSAGRARRCRRGRGSTRARASP